MNRIKLSAKFIEGVRDQIGTLSAPQTLTEAVEQALTVSSSSRGEAGPSPYDVAIVEMIVRGFLAQKFCTAVLRADKPTGHKLVELFEKLTQSELLAEDATSLIGDEGGDAVHSG